MLFTSEKTKQNIFVLPLTQLGFFSFSFTKLLGLVIKANFNLLKNKRSI